MLPCLLTVTMRVSIFMANFQSYISSPIAFLLVVNVIYLVIGMLLETNTAILITGPILIPMASSYGIDPVHFGAITIVNLCIGFITPPFAANLFVASRVGNVKIHETFREVVPFLIVGLVVLLLTTFIPTFSTYIPNYF